MRIVSWNVNGLQPTLKDATYRFTNASIYFTTILHADIVCFQESKIQEEKLEKWMACVPGYESFWAFSQTKKGHSGVVTYVKDELSPLDAAADKLPGDVSATEDLCREGRVVETDHGSFVLINVYVPNAGDRDEGRPRLDFKVRFLQALKRKCDGLIASGRHVVIVGDFNIAHKAIDVHQKWDVQKIYSSEENVWLDVFLTEYVDLFRHFHPDVTDVYSCWETKTDARIHNEGLRIDYAVCDKGFLSQVKDTQILKMVPKNWSDHAAVVLTLQEQPALPPHPPPSISSRNMKQFQEDRCQKKLTSLFSRGASKPKTVAGGGVTLPPKQGTPVESSNDDGSSPVNPNPSDLSSKPSTPVAENLEQGPEIDHQEKSPTKEAPASSRDRSISTRDDPSLEPASGAAGHNGISGEVQSADAPAHELNSVDANQNDLRTDDVTVQGKANEAKADGLDSIVPSKDNDVVTLAPESGVMAIVEAEEGSPLKRKLSSGSLTETGAATGKQRNLTSYFKAATRDTEGSADK